MSKRLLYTEDSPVSFKLGDTATEIKIQPFFTSEDVNIPVNLRSYRSIRLAIRNTHTYISSYPVSLFNDNTAVISSSQLEELPADQYFVELWCTDDNLHSDVFPSDEYLPLHISPNAMGELGETITKVSLDQAVKELNEKINDRLKDAKGEPGLSAYQVWLQDGNKGTIHDFLNSLKGDKGDKGDPGQQGIPGKQGLPGNPGKQGIQGEPGKQGEPGLSAYDLWLKAGNTGSQTDFLNSLKGEPGKDGQDGTNGDRGPQGEPGKSAYQEAVDNGFSGSLTDWLKSLKGEKGDKGEPGEPGRPGRDGKDGQPGQPGKDGADGKQGPEGKPGRDGKQGEPGKPATIKKTFQSIAQLQADKGEGFENGDFAVIANNENENDPDNGKLFVWNNGVFTYLFDMKGAQGIQGVPGVPGQDGKPGKDGQDGKNGVDGHDGLSAYQLAVNSGFKGTLNEWLDSLKGEPGKNGKDGQPGQPGKDGQPGEPGKDGQPGQPGKNGVDGKPGADGKSAYQVWLDAGNAGTVADFLKSLKGEKGDPGIQGEPGTPGKQGEPGQPGQEGQPGEPGKPGKDGLSAYQLWQAQGNVGTVDDFLKSLKGKDGQDGAQGAPGKNGVDGQPGEPGKPGKDGLDGKNVSENLIATSVVFPDFFDGTPYNFDTYPDPRTTFTTDVFIGTDPTKKSVVDVPYGTFAGLYQTGYSDNWYAKVNITVNGYPTGKPINWSFLRFKPQITINHINAVDNDGKTYASISGYNDKLTDGTILTKSVSMNSGGADACSALNQYIDINKIVTQGVDYTDLRTGKSYNKAPLVTMAYVVDSEPFTLKQTGPQEYDLALERVSNSWGDQGDDINMFIAGWYGNLPAICGSNDNWGTFGHASLNRVEAYQTKNVSFITPYENGDSYNSGVNVKTHGKQG